MAIVVEFIQENNTAINLERSTTRIAQKLAI